MTKQIDDLLTDEAPKRDDRTGELIRLQMSTSQGRAFMWMVLANTGMLQNPLHPDPTIMGFNTGKQDIGRWLFSEIERHCPDLYPVMVKEAQQKQETEQ